MCWASPANGVSATARRARVFLSTRRYTPDWRALARNRVMFPTGRPRYCATTIAWAFATWALTSATTAFFSSRLRLKVLPPFPVNRIPRERPAPRGAGHSPFLRNGDLETRRHQDLHLLFRVRRLRRTPAPGRQISALNRQLNPRGFLRSLTTRRIAPAAQSLHQRITR